MLASPSSSCRSLLPCDVWIHCFRQFSWTYLTDPLQLQGSIKLPSSGSRHILHIASSSFRVYIVIPTMESSSMSTRPIFAACMLSWGPESIPLVKPWFATLIFQIKNLVSNFSFGKYFDHQKQPAALTQHHFKGNDMLRVFLIPYTANHFFISVAAPSKASLSFL